jgi:hypothetical protein
MWTWKDPRTWADGPNELTSSRMNVEVRDNLRWLYNPPRLFATNDADQGIEGAVADVPILFPQVEVDNDLMSGQVAAGTSQPQQATFIVRTAGVFLVSLNAMFEVQASGERDLGIRHGTIDGAIQADAYYGGYEATALSYTPAYAISCLVKVTAGQFIQGVARSTFASTTELIARYGLPTIAIHWVGAGG